MADTSPAPDAPRPGARWRDAPTLLGLAALALPLIALAGRCAGPAVLSFGPNDRDYVRGFREGWERDGPRTRFRWTSPAASVTLPLHVRGEGARIRLRARRHFVEPARVTLRVEGRVVHRFELRAHAGEPYRVEGVALPALTGRHPFTLAIEAPSENPRPLGIAMDWLELERGRARFAPTRPTLARALLLVMVAFLLPRLAGGGTRLAAASGAAALLAMAALLAAAPLAAERALREGVAAWAATGGLCAALLRWGPARRALGITSPTLAGALTAVVLAALGLRLAGLLHPLYFYPDVRVHALFSHELARRGLAAFLENFTANQFRYSLGLQLENGHWYAFPYPPAFYLLTWPLVGPLALRAEVAVTLVAAAVNSLEVLVVFALARRLARSPAVSLAAAALVPLLPLFTTRLTLAYFPALVGHFADAVVLLYLATSLERLDRPRTVLTLGVLIALALLVYTQSLVNMAILLGSFLIWQGLADRSPAARRRQVGLAAAGALGALLALGAFYGRYVPIAIDMQRGVPMPEERILLEQMERRAERQPVAAEPPDDPYAGPALDPLRGLRKAGWRLWLFYGPFALPLVAGWLLLARGQRPDLARLVLCWGGTYLLLNLASGGLPGPNLLRYNKDLEIVAPLGCIALAAAAAWLWAREHPMPRGAAAAAWAAFVVWGGVRAHAQLVAHFDLVGY